MSKEVLVTDMDEVFFPFAAYFVEHHNTHHGTELTFNDITSYSFEKIIGEKLEETVRRVHAATEADHSNVKPIEHSLESVERLTTAFDLTLLTARDPKHEELTIKWLNMIYGSDIFNDVIHVGHVGAGYEPVRKVDVCLEIGAIALIDDSPKHIEEVAKVGIEGGLFGNYKWNQLIEFSNGVMPEGVIRLENWPAVTEHFGV